jgi:hypothetical protein
VYEAGWGKKLTYVIAASKVTGFVYVVFYLLSIFLTKKSYKTEPLKPSVGSVVDQ